MDAFWLCFLFASRVEVEVKDEDAADPKTARAEPLGSNVDSPESFQDRVKRKTREMRLKNERAQAKKDEQKTKKTLHRRFLSRYGLGSKNLFSSSS